MKKINALVQTIASGEKINTESYDFITADYILRMLKYELKVFDKDDQYKDDNKYIELLKYLTRVRSNFESIFVNTVESVEYMKMYLITHSVFDIHDNTSRDWFINFMMSYLTPTEREVNEYLKLTEIPEDLKELMDGVFSSIPALYVSELDDGKIITYGLWQRNSDGRVTNPILIKDVDDAFEKYENFSMEAFMQTIEIIDLSDDGVSYLEKME